MFLREKLERPMGLRDDDPEKDAGSGAQGDDDALQPEPGESPESFEARKTEYEATQKGEEEDRGDDVEAKTDKKADDEGDKKADDEPAGIPKSRLDGALKRAREAEAELRKLRAEQAKEPPKDDKKADDDDAMTIEQAEARVAELDIEVAKALKDEEKTDADVAKLIREQRELGEAIRDAKLEDAQADTRARTAEEIQFDRVVTELEENIPALNPENEAYNEDLVQETITLAQALHAQGRSQGDSMLLAVDYMSEKLGVNKATMEEVKKTTDVEKNVELAKKMPPDLPGSPGTTSDKGGLTGTAEDAVRMSDQEFDTLTKDSDRFKQLRGDFG